MSRNNSTTLTQPRRAKKDEFYTSFEDIAREVETYVEYDPEVFSGRSVLCPCDVPSESAFVEFFAQNFDRLGLRRLVATCFRQGGRGEVFIKEAGEEDCSALLHGDGDFRSEEVSAFRDETDFIITNPPFSLFREFVAWARAGHAKVSIVGNMNASSCADIFPLIHHGQLWYGSSITGGDREFRVPDDYPLTASGSRVDEKGTKFVRVKGVRWFTDIQNVYRHKPLELRTMEENLRNNKQIKAHAFAYQEYDNYPAIEVPYTSAIPLDYEGVMGVPISFLDKYCPEQFKILGITDSRNSSGLKTKTYTKQDHPTPGSLNSRATLVTPDGGYKSTYVRLLIEKI